MNDVQTLLEMIQKLSQAGDRQKAAQLLAMLQSMLENMRMTPGPAAARAAPQNKALNEKLQKFGGLMGKQRALLDKTFRQQQGQADPKDGGAAGLAETAERPGKGIAGFAEGHGRQVGAEAARGRQGDGRCAERAGPERT